MLKWGWTYIKNFLHPHNARVDVAYARMKKANERHAQHTAELEYHLRMKLFYERQLKETDPNTDWWEWAEAKEREHEHTKDAFALETKARRLSEQALAREAQYRTLRGKNNV